MSRFFARKPAAILAVLAASSMAVWALAAAPQVRNPKGKAHGGAAITSRDPVPDVRVSAGVRSVRKLGLITSYTSPGVFLLDPDTNTVSGPILSDQLDALKITCAAVTADGMTAVVEDKAAVVSARYGQPVLHLVDLADPSRPSLLGSAVPMYGGFPGHVFFSPDGKYVMATETTSGTEFWGDLEVFSLSSRTLVGGASDHVVSETSPDPDDVPFAIISPDGETVLMMNARWAFHGYLYRLDPSSGQLTLLSGTYPSDIRGAAFSPDGRTAIIGTRIYNPPAQYLSISRLDSPCHFISTAKLAPAELPISIAFAPGGKKAYALGSNAIWILNVESPGVVVDSGITIPVDSTGAQDPDSFAIEPQGRYAYVGGPVIKVIDLKTYSLVGTIPTGAKSISFPNPILSDVGLTKSVDNLYPVLNDTISFTVTATNNGPRDATGVKILDQIPDGLSYISHSTGSGTYDPAAGVWNIGSLGQENSAMLTVRAKVDKIGSPTNTARLQSLNQADPEPANDAASVTIEADVRPDFSNPQLNYAGVDRLAARAGQIFTFTINYGNSGGRAHGSVITNPIDARLENIQPLDGGGISNGAVVWSLGKIAANARGSVRFQASVKMDVPRGTKIPCQAAIVSNQTSPVVTNTVFVTVL